MTAYRDPRSNRWRYRTRVTLPDGRVERISGTPETNTKKAAEAKERAHIFRLQNPEAVARVDKAKEVPTLEAYAEVFLQGYAADHKPREKEDKRRILDRCILPTLGGLRLDEIRQVTVDVLRAELLAEGVRGPKTVSNILSVLSSLMKYAAQNGVIEEPRIRFVSGVVQDGTVHAVPMKDVERLIGVTEDPRYRLGILLAAEAGLRMGEIRALRWEDVDQIGRRVTVAKALDMKGRVTAPKHNKVRRVPMSTRIWEALRGMEQRGKTVITLLRSSRPLSYWAMRDKIHDLYGEAEVTVPPEPWHGLRHTFGTELANAGTPIHVIKEMMGHASITTTLRYMHTNEQAQRDALSKTFG